MAGLPEDWKNRPVSELPWWMLVWLVIAFFWVFTAVVFFSVAVAKQFPPELRPLVLTVVFPVAFWRAAKWVE